MWIKFSNELWLRVWMWFRWCIGLMKVSTGNDKRFLLGRVTAMFLFLFFVPLKKNYMQISSEKTLGESRVRTDFNVSGSSAVDEIKRKSAELINFINELPMPEKFANDKINQGEFMRAKAKALTEIEDGAMWAVKAATI